MKMPTAIKPATEEMSIAVGITNSQLSTLESQRRFQRSSSRLKSAIERQLETFLGDVFDPTLPRIAGLMSPHRFAQAVHSTGVTGMHAAVSTGSLWRLF